MLPAVQQHLPKNGDKQLELIMGSKPAHTLVKIGGLRDKSRQAGKRVPGFNELKGVEVLTLGELGQWAAASQNFLDQEADEIQKKLESFGKNDEELSILLQEFISRRQRADHLITGVLKALNEATEEVIQNLR